MALASTLATALHSGPQSILSTLPWLPSLKNKSKRNTKVTFPHINKTEKTSAVRTFVCISLSHALNSACFSSQSWERHCNCKVQIVIINNNNNNNKMPVRNVSVCCKTAMLWQCTLTNTVICWASTGSLKQSGMFLHCTWAPQWGLRNNVCHLHHCRNSCFNTRSHDWTGVFFWMQHSQIW